MYLRNPAINSNTELQPHALEDTNNNTSHLWQGESTGLSNIWQTGANITLAPGISSDVLHERVTGVASTGCCCAAWLVACNGAVRMDLNGSVC